MRITYVPDTFPQVSETFVLNEIRWLVERGDDVVVVPRAAGRDEAWNDDRAGELREKIEVDVQLGDAASWAYATSVWRASSVWPGKRPARLVRHFRNAKSVAEHAKRIARHPCDAIVCHFGYDNAIAASIVGERLHVPVIQWLHGSDLYTVPHRHLSWFASRAASIVTNSNYSKRLIRDLGITRKVEVVGLGVDLTTFRPGSSAEKEEQPTLMCVGRLGHNKNHARLLRVLLRVQKSVPDVKLWIAGAGPDRELLERMSRDLHIENHVEFLGRVYRQDLALRMRRAWAFALLSDKEGLGVVFMEAQASGLPCIGPHVGGVPEVVEEGVTGHLIDFSKESGETEAASAIVDLLQNADRRVRMSKAAIERADRLFDENAACARVAEVIDRAVAEYGQPFNAEAK